MSEVNSGTITLIGVDYKYQELTMRQDALCFYPENPRIYSLLDVSDGVPDQDQIQKTMIGFDHVKQLKVSIKDNGGLIDPLIVKDIDNVVLEGNSRLAAYRLLAEEEPIKWGLVRCQVLPADIPDDAVFALLGQYHVGGKTDWSPYEQAGFLTRQHRATKRPIDQLAKVLGITVGDAKRLIKTYEFMAEQNDLEPTRWSYYDEYLKNRGIKRYREVYPDMDTVVAGAIQSGEIHEAMDVRKVLGEIAKSDSREAKQVMQDIVNGGATIYEGLEILKDTGKIGDVYKDLQRFNDIINRKDFESRLSKEDYGQTQYQLRQIKKRVDYLLNKIKQ
jgi:hypothetical protein